MKIVQSAGFSGRHVFRVVILFLGLSISTGAVSSSPNRDMDLAQSSNNDWPQVAHDAQRTAYSPTAIVPPMKVKWRWVNGNKWTGDPLPKTLDVEIPVLSQPIVGDNKVFVGSYEGAMYAIKATDGSTLWQFQTGGPILHSAAYAKQTVYFGSNDEHFYAVDTNTGAIRWTFKTGNIYSAPLLVANNVCIGSKTGYFYCFRQDSTDGSPLFQVSVGAPIYQTAAASQDGTRIYFGSEDMIPHCLLTASGQTCPEWNPYTIPGQSLFHYWPVVSDDKVIFTSMPYYPTNVIFGDTEEFFDSLTETDWTSIEPKLLEHLKSNPYYQTFFVLDAKTGQKAYDTAVAHIGYHQDAFVPPTLLPSNELLLLYRGKTSSLGGSFGTKYGPDLGRMDLSAGKITPLGKPDQFGNTFINELDDNVAIMSAPDVVYGIHNGWCSSAIDYLNNQSFVAGRISESTQSNDCQNTSPIPYFFSDTDVYPDIRGYNNRGEGLMSPSIAGNSMYMVFRGGYLLAVEGTQQ